VVLSLSLTVRVSPDKHTRSVNNVLYLWMRAKEFKIRIVEYASHTHEWELLLVYITEAVQYDIIYKIQM
jgi:hypothetical protein